MAEFAPVTAGMPTLGARIAKWREFAKELGIADDQIPIFVADRMEREEKEAEEKERKLQLEERRLQLEAEERERRLQQEAEEHELRLELMRAQSSRQNERSTTTSGTATPNQSEETVHVNMPFFDESKDDITVWLAKFERIAKLYKWAEETWATRISTRLTGNAADVYNRLDEDDIQNYQILKAALLFRYQLTAETYRKRFREAKRKDNETYRQFGARLRTNLDKWQELS